MSNHPSIAPRGLTLRQTAAYWGVSYHTFRRLLRDGFAPKPVNIGTGRMIFDRKDTRGVEKAT